MNTQKKLQTMLEDLKVSLELELAMLWASLMFLYIHVDYFRLYMPGKIEYLMKSRAFKFDITQGFLFFNTYRYDNSGANDFHFRFPAG